MQEKEPVRRYARMDEQVEQIRRVWWRDPGRGRRADRPRAGQAGAADPGRRHGAEVDRSRREVADGVYSWSGNGVAEEMQTQQQRVVEEWDKAGRDRAPERIAGFWCSTAPNADEKLKAYVYKYLKVLGDGPATAISGMCDRSTPDAIMASLDAYEAAGVEECWLNTATAEMAEIDGLEEIIAKRG